MFPVMAVVELEKEELLSKSTMPGRQRAEWADHMFGTSILKVSKVFITCLGGAIGKDLVKEPLHFPLDRLLN